MDHGSITFMVGYGPFCVPKNGTTFCNYRPVTGTIWAYRLGKLVETKHLDKNGDATFMLLTGNCTFVAKLVNMSGHNLTRTIHMQVISGVDIPVTWNNNTSGIDL